MPTKRTRWREKITKGRSRIWKTVVDKNDPTRWYRHGVVATPLGYVWVYSEEAYTTYGFVWRGVEHSTSEQRGRTVRGIAIMARRFVREITGAMR